MPSPKGRAPNDLRGTSSLVDWTGLTRARRTRAQKTTPNVFILSPAFLSRFFAYVLGTDKRLNLGRAAKQSKSKAQSVSRNVTVNAMLRGRAASALVNAQFEHFTGYLPGTVTGFGLALSFRREAAGVRAKLDH